MAANTPAPAATPRAGDSERLRAEVPVVDQLHPRLRHRRKIKLQILVAEKTLVIEGKTADLPPLDGRNQHNNG
jgi:hypothetical protein